MQSAETQRDCIALCGERGRRYQVTILRNSLILNSCTSQNFIFFALLWRKR